MSAVEDVVIGRETVQDALGGLRDRLTTLEVKHTYTDAAVQKVDNRVGDMATRVDARFSEMALAMERRWENTDAKIDHITSLLEKQAGGMAVGRWVIGIAGTLVVAVLGLLSQIWKH